MPAFDAAVRAIKRDMREGTIPVDVGLAAIRDLMVSQLRARGFASRSAMRKRQK